MKKILKNMLIILLTASMLFLFVGCGNKEESTNTNNTTNEQTSGEQKVEFSMGEWNDNVYTNDFLGLKFNLPDGWVYSSDEEMAESLNKGLELFDDNQREKLEEALETKGIYYLQAIDSTTNNNVQVFTEKVATGISEEYYLEQVSKQLSELETIDYNIGEIAKEKVSNKEYTILKVEIPEYDVLQKYFIYKKDNYIVGIIVTSITGETAISEVIKNFE